MLAVLIVWLAGACWAQPAVVLAPGLDRVALSGHLAWLEDPEGAFSVNDVQHATTWQSLAGMPNPGFTQSTIWVRLSVQWPVESSARWILSVDNTQIDEVKLYQPDRDGGWHEQKAGRAWALRDWPLNARTPSFFLDLSPGEHAIYLRLKGEHTLSSTLSLMTAEASQVASNREALIFGAYFGVYAVVIVLQLFFWVMGHQDKVSGWYLLYTLTLMTGTVIYTGYPQNYFNITASVSTPILGVYLCAAPAIIAKLTALWLELDRHLPLISKFYQGIIYAFAAMASVLVLADQYGLGVQLMQLLTLLWTQLSLGLGLVLWLRGSPNAGHYVIIFGFIDLGLMARFMRNLGLLPVGFGTDYGLHIGITLHLVAMSLFFIYRFRNLEDSLEVEQRARAEQREFVAMVSHEFRTPLAIINTSIQQLSANLDAPVAKSQQRAENIRHAVHRMNMLLDDYLSMDRLDSAQQAARPRPCDIYEIIEEAISDWPLERIHLEVQALPQRWVCDPDLLRIALRNLLANAMRHSPDSSRVDVRVWCTGRTLHIAVQDHGEGIPPDELPRLFQKYFRGKSAQGKPGAGLGLYLVRRIVHAHGGEVTVQSTPGEGAMFCIRLPANEGRDMVLAAPIASR